MSFKLIVSKDEFVSYIDDIKNSMDYQKELNKLFSKYNVDGYLFQPDCSASLIRLLNKVFHVSSQDGYIEKFCFETDFGKKNIPGSFLNKRKKEVKISTSEDLYDLLLELYEMNGGADT